MYSYERTHTQFIDYATIILFQVWLILCVFLGTARGQRHISVGDIYMYMYKIMHWNYEKQCIVLGIIYILCIRM